MRTNDKQRHKWERRQYELQQQQQDSRRQEQTWKQRQQQQLVRERESPPPSFTLQHILQGHSHTITSIAWSPDGQLLASASADTTIRLWDVEKNSSRATFRGHSNAVTSIAWSPDGQLLASASADTTVRLWDVEKNSSDTIYQAYSNTITSIAWSPDGRLLAVGSADKTIRLWDAEKNLRLLTSNGSSIIVPDFSDNTFAHAEAKSGLPIIEYDSEVTSKEYGLGQFAEELSRPFQPQQIASIFSPRIESIRLLEAAASRLTSLAPGVHSDAVIRIAWSSDGHLLASASNDGIICIWDAGTGQQIRRLEGHTDAIFDISFSCDDHFLASKSFDGTVRLWNLDVWEEAQALNESSSGSFGSGLAFHPHLPVLATLGELDRVIRIWYLDVEAILRMGSSASNAHYTNARVVLVGDSGVGKSGLGLVLAKKTWVPTESTHGRYVWMFEERNVALNNGGAETRETLLWDLAGQPGYRLIHQLHLNDVSVALVVFDASSETNPFAGVYHWERALRIAQEKQNSGAAALKKFLVAARIDRGGTAVSHTRIDALKRELGFDDYFETSAKEGTEVEKLRVAIIEAIDWEKLPKVSSTVLFQSIKGFLVDQKKSGRVLSTVEDLYHTFLQLNAEAQQEQFETCIGQVESQGLIRRLSFGNFVLLQPELLDAYASALVNAVKEEPDGLGNIAEEKVLAGRFAMPEDQRIQNKEQEKLLLIAMIEDLLRFEIALRESADDGTYLIFPSQSTRENVDMPDPEEKTVLFSFEGPVLNIYATLTVRFSHSGQFRKKELWRNAITYESSVGGTCGILLRNMGEGRGELTLFFDKKASEQTRLQFEQYIYIHLQRRALPESIKRKPVFICSNCGFVVTTQLLRLRKERNCNWVDCPNCQTHISLLDSEERLIAEPSPAVQAMDRAADKQRDLATAQSMLQGKLKIGDFDVFLCHNNMDKAAVKKIGEQLKERGILPWLDEWELRPGIPWQRLLEEQIGKIKSAAVFVGKNGRGPWQQQELDAFLREFVKRNCPVIPVLLSTSQKKPQLPIFLSGMTWVDFRKQDLDPLERLIWGITGERSLGQQY